MRRRTFLQSTGAGVAALSTAASLAGCIALDGSSESRDPVDFEHAEPIELTYPLSRTYFIFPSEPAPDADSATPVAELPADVRFDVVNAITHEHYLTYERRADDEAYGGPFEYRGRTFDVGRGHADVFVDPETLPENDPDWVHPVEISVAATDDELGIELRNRLDEPLPVFHTGRPYFGPLVAVGDSVATLQHDAYESNPAIHETDGVLQAREVDDAQEQQTVIDSGETLTERYELPSDRPEDGRIWIDQWIDTDGIDQLRPAARLVTGTYVLE